MALTHAQRLEQIAGVDRDGMVRHFKSLDSHGMGVAALLELLTHAGVTPLCRATRLGEAHVSLRFKEFRVACIVSILVVDDASARRDLDLDRGGVVLYASMSALPGAPTREADLGVEAFLRVLFGNPWLDSFESWVSLASVDDVPHLHPGSPLPLYHELEGSDLRARHCYRRIETRWFIVLVAMLHGYREAARRVRPERAWGVVDLMTACLADEICRNEIVMAKALAQAGVEHDFGLSVARVLLDFAEAGEQIIAVESGLQRALARTDPMALERLPLRAFAVALAEPADGATMLVVAARDTELTRGVPMTVLALPPGFPLQGQDGGGARIATDEQVALALNVVAYVENVGAERASNGAQRERAQREADRRRGAKAQRAAERAAATPVVTTVRIGAGYEPARGVVGAGEGATRRAHWVRGHWRQQPHGPRSAPSTRARWIEPHQRCRGSAAGEVQGRTYLVQS